MTAPRVVFAGTPAFALASLKRLVDAGVVPVAVYTQPDRPAGRGKQLTPSPVKVFAEACGIDVFQPPSLRDPESIRELRALEPALMIVAAYGLLLPQEVLDIPTRGCVNVHASLLPRWRGAAPIQAAILAGDEQTGISLMSMTAGLDCGPVYATATLAIGPQDNAGEVHDRLADLGGDLLVAQLPSLLAGELAAVPQDDAEASYAGKIKTEHARLDWSEPAEMLARKVRAYNPVPGAWFVHNNERIKCWQASAVGSDAVAAPGQVLDSDRLIIACGEGALALEQLQRPGKRSISAEQFKTQLDWSGQTLAIPSGP